MWCIVQLGPNVDTENRRPSSQSPSVESWGPALVPSCVAQWALPRAEGNVGLELPLRPLQLSSLASSLACGVVHGSLE